MKEFKVPKGGSKRSRPSVVGLAVFLYRQGVTPDIDAISRLDGPMSVQLDYDEDGYLQAVRIEEVDW